jgi:hypothetical protein
MSTLAEQQRAAMKAATAAQEQVKADTRAKSASGVMPGTGFLARAAQRRAAIRERGTGGTGFTAAEMAGRDRGAQQALVDARADRMEGNSERMKARRAAAPSAQPAAPSAQPAAPSAKPAAPSAKPAAPSAKPAARAAPKAKASSGNSDSKAWAKKESNALWASKEREKLAASKKAMAARNNDSVLSKAVGFVKKAPTVQGYDSYKKLMG